MAIKSLERLIDQFHKLPGIGRKSATRLGFHILDYSEQEIDDFIQALEDVKGKIKRCPVCGDYCEDSLCPICADEARDRRSICIVEDSRDVISLEKTGKYRGLYHILGGKLAPLQGVTPDKLNLKTLLERITKEEIQEIILALNPDLEGETTAMYLVKLLKPFDIRITKIASGIPMGGNLEFADSATIARALDARQEV